MAHNINSMAYMGETPWHGLGTKVDHAMTSAEAMTAASMDWAVEKRSIYYEVNGGAPRGIGDHFAVVRADTEDVLGVVGAVYRPLQNKEAFSFFDAIVGEKLAIYHTAGTLGKGEKIWLLAKLPGEIWISKEDNVEKYLLLTNSHDGSTSVQIMATPIRVVCQNTLNMSLGAWKATKQKTRVRHTNNIGAGIEAIRDQLGIADQYYRLFEEAGRHLASKQASVGLVEALFNELGLGRFKATQSTRTANIREEIQVLFEKGKGNDLPSIKGTAWALLNGVVEYCDYRKPVRGENSEDGTNRTASLLFGSAAQMKQKTLDSLLTLTK